MLRPVEDGSIGAAIAWGPLAGGFARRSKVRLVVTPLAEASDRGQPMQFAIISFSDTPLYAHGARTIRIGSDALVDQQRAGLIMWVPAGIIMMAIGLAIFAAWLGQSARRIAQSPHPSLR